MQEGRQVIPEAAVEAAAKAYRAKVEWIDRHSRDDYGREDELGMRAALEAAAPHMLAAIEALADELLRDGERAEHYAEHGQTQAKGVRESLYGTEIAMRIREALSAK